MDVTDFDDPTGLSQFNRSPGEGRMWAECWCGAETLPVLVELVQSCRTESCGSLFCTEPTRLWEAP